MSYFQPEPVLTLDTIEDVKRAITSPRNNVCGFKGMDAYRIKSLWIISLIDEIAAHEYPYNATVKKLASERLGLPPQSDADYAREGDTLSLLVYNAQCYRHSDDYKARGFEPFTEDLIKRAHEEGKELEVLSEGIVGSAFIRLKVRAIQGHLYAMRPKTRTRYMAAQGQPARLVA